MPSNEPCFRFLDITTNIDRINRHLDGYTFETFCDDEKTIDAVERCFQRITEAAIKLRPLSEELAPSQDWAAIRGFGNVLRHEYDNVTEQAIWRYATENLSSLRDDCQRALDHLAENLE